MIGSYSVVGTLCFCDGVGGDGRLGLQGQGGISSTKYRKNRDAVARSKDAGFVGAEFEAKWPSKCSKVVAEEFQIHQGHTCCDIVNPSKEMGDITMAIIIKAAAE